MKNNPIFHFYIPAKISYYYTKKRISNTLNDICAHCYVKQLILFEYFVKETVETRHDDIWVKLTAESCSRVDIETSKT